LGGLNNPNKNSRKPKNHYFNFFQVVIGSCSIHW